MSSWWLWATDNKKERRGANSLSWAVCLPVALLAACQRRAACRFSALKGLYLVSLVPSGGWCPQPGKEVYPLFPAIACQREARMADFQNRNSCGGWSSKTVIYTLGKMRQLFWNEGKSSFLKFSEPLSDESIWESGAASREHFDLSGFV